MARYRSAPGTQVPLIWAKLGFKAINRSHWRCYVGGLTIDYWPWDNRWTTTSGRNVETETGDPEHLRRAIKSMREAEARAAQGIEQ